MHTPEFGRSLLERVAGSSAAGLSYWDAGGRCLYANAAFLHFQGSPSDLPMEILPGHPQAMDLLFQALRGNGDTLCLDTAALGLLCRITYIPDEGGCVVQLDRGGPAVIGESDGDAMEAHFRALVRDAPGPVAITGPGGTIEMLNRGAELLFGYGSGEVRGLPAEMLLAERFRVGQPNGRGDFMGKISTGSIGSLALAGLRKDGTEFSAEAAISPMRSGGTLLAAVSFRDLSAREAREGRISSYHRALQRQQQQTEDILDSISESFCLLDASWHIRYWNPAAEKATGKSRQVVLGRGMWEVFPQEPGSTLYDGCDAVMGSREARSFEHQSAEGTWFYNSAHPNSDGGLTIYFKDITDRKRVEHEIVAMKNNQYALINATRDLIWSLDRDYRLVSANHAFTAYAETLLGYRPGPGDAVLFGERLTPTDAEWKGLLDRGLRGESFITEPKSTPDQLTQFNPIVDPVSGEITGVACHSANISERKRMERESVESAERFRAVVQHGSDLIFLLDGAFSLNYISPSAVSLLGYGTGMSGVSLLERIHPESADMVLRGIRSTASRRVVKLGEFRIRDMRGEWIWIEATISNLLDNPAVVGLVVNACHITESKRREAEREQLIKELTRSNDDLMQFSFITSHNLRAPLSNITGLLAAFERSPLDPESAGILDMIGASAQKLSQTINDLSQILIIRNSPEIPTGWLDIGKVFRRVNRNFIEAENDIDAQLSLALEATHANFNEGYLESIFINLISNAIKYRSADRTLAISLETRQEPGGVLLSFRDNGKGIDLERHRSRLFGMYQRFHPNTEGQGLGLFIIKEQIAALGGRVDVESTVGRGTAFHILLPSEF